MLNEYLSGAQKSLDGSTLAEILNHKDGEFYLNRVKEFNQMGGKPHGERDPGNVPPNERQLLYNLIREELEEFKTAMEAGDLTEILDALGDLQYVLCVAVIFHGLDKVFPTAFMEIHRANMMKFPPADQGDEFEVAIKSRYPDTPFLIHEKEGHLVALRKRDGKILKPGPCTPNLKQFIHEQAGDTKSDQ